MIVTRLGFVELDPTIPDPFLASSKLEIQGPVLPITSWYNESSLCAVTRVFTASDDYYPAISVSTFPLCRTSAFLEHAYCPYCDS